MQSNKLKRLLHLITLVQGGHGAKAEFLAKSLGCSERTLFRDLELLKESGVPVSFDVESGCYAIEHGNESPLPRLNEEEWLAVLMAASISMFSQSLPFNGNVNKGIAKLVAAAPDPVRKRFNRLIRAVVNENDLKTNTVEAPKLRILLDAIDRRKRIQVTYVDEPAKTVVSPYRTVYRAGHWHLEGWSSIHRGTICVPLYEISDAEILSESFQIPISYLQAGHTGGRVLNDDNNLEATV